MIASVQNPLVKYLVKLRENREYREEIGSVVISGAKLVREVAAIAAPKKIFVEESKEAFLEGEIIQVSHAVLKKITGLPSPEPIAAEFDLPSPSTLKQKKPLLVLDAIRDPGNLGTLLRTALSFGWGGVFFLPTCADPFHEKTIRSSRAALFRLPWREGSWEELFKLQKEENLTLYIADIEGKPLSSIQPSEKVMLLLSNEAQGVAKTGEKFGEKITIPMMGEMESLNVAIAGAIIMYYLRTK